MLKINIQIQLLGLYTEFKWLAFRIYNNINWLSLQATSMKYYIYSLLCKYCIVFASNGTLSTFISPVWTNVEEERRVSGYFYADMVIDKPTQTDARKTGETHWLEFHLSSNNNIAETTAETMELNLFAQYMQQTTIQRNLWLQSENFTAQTTTLLRVHLKGSMTFFFLNVWMTRQIEAV